jgi:hypothetical protein
MLSDALKHQIAEACVTVPTGTGFGRGVLVGGQLLLTAAHVVIPALAHVSPYPLDAALIGLSLGDHVVLELTTTREIVHVAPYALDPATDIAVLGPLDAQVFWDKAEAYEAWCNATAPVPLCLDDWAPWQPTPVAVYTHHGTWLAGTAEHGDPTSHIIWASFPEGIEGGTSGSPIVNMQGAIVGIVSQFGGTEPDALERGRSGGRAPRPHLTLPVWVMQHVRQAMETPKEM